MNFGIASPKENRDILLNDKYRPAYHFAISNGLGWAADPNGAFFADGIYHLMYLYKNINEKTFHWGHISSKDLIHWREHKDALTAPENCFGCYSGGAFVDDDGTAYAPFWKCRSTCDSNDFGGICMSLSRPPYDDWKIIEKPIIHSDAWGITDLEIDGEIVHIGSADPSNIWKANGIYYMQTGNKMVLDAYGRADDSDLKYQGDWTELFSSSDLKEWKYEGRFYTNPHMDVDGYPDRTEDDMCPSFLPLFDAEENGKATEKYLLLFISHNKGCQYYIGHMDGVNFVPEKHGRMSWHDNMYFAPEALIDGKNRQIMWAWLNDRYVYDRYGWSGVFGVPRNLWYEDGELKMAPVSELDSLQYGHIAYDAADGDTVKVGDGDLCRIKAIWHYGQNVGIRVKVNDDESEYVEISYSPYEKKLVLDTTHCGCDERNCREAAPLELRVGEELSLDILIDRSVIEVYANKRQGICRRVYPKDVDGCLGVKLTGEAPKKLDTYRMFPSNPF